MFNFFGNLASVVGLIVSAFAAYFAKRASTAARKARDSAMRQSLSEDMNAAARTSNEIVIYLGDDRNESALLRIADLMRQTSYLIRRWDMTLSKRSKDNLHFAREQLHSIHDALGGNAGEALAPDQKKRLLRVGQRVRKSVTRNMVRPSRLRGQGKSNGGRENR